MDTAAAERPVPLLRRLSAELVGTAALTFAATTVTGPEAAKVIAPALVVGALVFTIGSVSGALINPAVTLAFALRGAFPWAVVPAYWAAQLVGAVLAGLGARAILGEPARKGIPQTHVDSAHAFWWELVLTALLIFVILGTANKARLLGPEAAIPVAATLATAGLIGGPFTGASINPARAAGPALAFGHLPATLYLVAPLIGAAAAVGVAFAVFGRTRSEEERAALGEGGAPDESG